MKYIPVIILFLLVSCNDDDYINPSEQISHIPVIDIHIDEYDLDKLLNNRTLNINVPCKIEYRDCSYKAEIRAAGAGARFYPKWSFKITLQKGKTIEGLNEFNLSAQVLDRTMMKTSISSNLYKAAGFPVFFSCHTFLRVNRKDYGLYLIIEKIDKPFFEERNIGVIELYKLIFKAKLSFNTNFYPQFGIKKIFPDDNNLESMVELIKMADSCKADNVFSQLGKLIDIDNYLMYSAASILLNNWDGYENNVYFYRPDFNTAFKVVPWDFDKCFDYEFVRGMSGENGILDKLFQNDSAFALYKEKIKYLLEYHFTEDNILHTIDSLYNIIEFSYSLDPQLKYYDFDKEALLLKEFIRNRRNYFKENIDSYTQDDYFR